MLTGKYLDFYNRLLPKIPKEQMFHDPLTTLAFGTDASFYRLVPKLVIKAYNIVQVREIIFAADYYSIPITFRAAGTSLSGQSISDSVLVITTHGFDSYSISTYGETISLGPGMKGGRVNKLLKRYRRQLGPDPASIDSAMIGGIVANNSSGMCCGTSQNTYKTIDEIDIILADGTSLNTADIHSIARFEKSHPELVKGLKEIREQIINDEKLKDRIIRKYKIKNTTGYSLNSFIDFEKIEDIVKHLIVGSEGTLAFIAGVSYRTVVNHRDKALSLALFDSIELACKAVQVLTTQSVSAVELIDRASIRSVENAEGVPSYLKELDENACGLLIEIREEDKPTLYRSIKRVSESLSDFHTIKPLEFTLKEDEQEVLWKVRKECLPTVAGMRKSGTTAIIEDVCFPLDRLAEAVSDLRKLFDKDGYSDAVIFGHALAGNLHFMFNQDFRSDEQIQKYAKLMDDVTDLVVHKYDGSLKAEHGTGRNMAPFVEKEWGEQAYSINKRIKELFDPKGIFNPGVIINPNPTAHISNLKPSYQTSELVDKCMECGFCENSCVTEGYTFSPRQRVVAYKEIERVKKNKEDKALLGQLIERYHYFGEKSCATDSLCKRACPVKIDTGKLTKTIREKSHTKCGNKQAMFVANHINNTMWWVRAGLNATYYLSDKIGEKRFRPLASFVHNICGIVPQWHEDFPKGAKRIPKALILNKRNYKDQDENKKPKVVYMPSCITRSIGKGKKTIEAKELTELTHRLLEKAGYEVIYPKNLKHLCCGMAFTSKGYTQAGMKLSNQLQNALNEASENGRYPILCDNSPCLYTMKNNFGTELPLYEPAEFAKKFLIPRLKINPIGRTVAVWCVCSSKKMEVDKYIIEIAKLCAKRAVIIEGNCCGFAGDKGFTDPKINEWGLRNIKSQLSTSVEGYATSRTCEVGLTKNSGLVFKNLLYLLDEASEPMEDLSSI